MKINTYLLSVLLLLPAPSFALSAQPPYAEIQTNLGTITVQLNFDKAPLSSANFVTYSNSGFYKNTLIHRAVQYTYDSTNNPNGNPYSVIQGGGFDLQTRKPKTTNAAIKNESSNGLSNKAATIAMARTQAIDSATSQFFINVTNNSPVFDKTASSAGYAVFGDVVAGLDVAKAISLLNTYDMNNYYDGFPFTKTNSLVMIENVYLSDTIDTTKSITRVMVADGLGKITSSSGIKCGVSPNTCTTTKAAHATKKITLTATAAPNYVFNGWRGDCQGYKKAISLDLKSNHNCTASFVKLTP